MRESEFIIAELGMEKLESPSRRCEDDAAKDADADAGEADAGEADAGEADADAPTPATSMSADAESDICEARSSHATSKSELEDARESEAGNLRWQGGTTTKKSTQEEH